jgi:hypothetical protein
MEPLLDNILVNIFTMLTMEQRWRLRIVCRRFIIILKKNECWNDFEQCANKIYDTEEEYFNNYMFTGKHDPSKTVKTLLIPARICATSPEIWIRVAGTFARRYVARKVNESQGIVPFKKSIKGISNTYSGNSKSECGMSTSIPKPRREPIMHNVDKDYKLPVVPPVQKRRMIFSDMQNASTTMRKLLLANSDFANLDPEKEFELYEIYLVNLKEDSACVHL